MNFTNLTEQNSRSVGLLLKFSEAEFKQLKQGFTPQNMDDRWLVRFESDSLRCYRSWSGHEIFRARLEPVKEGYEIAWLHVLADKSVYNSHGEAQDIENFKCFIKFILNVDKFEIFD